MINEIWKDIKGYEGRYQVSNLGRVKSLGRSMFILYLQIVILGIVTISAIIGLILDWRK